ncbi:MAG: aldo/keto reductase [Halobacteriota archaeon]
MVSGQLPLGFGVSKIPPEQVTDVVETALDVGYRHVDNAQYYGNAKAVGEALARSNVDRDDLFITTKVKPDNLGFEGVLRSVPESLDRLGLDRVDLLYVHGPYGEYDPDATIDAFDELYERGLYDRFGVSNFSIEQLEEAADRADAPIFANQVEMHPLYRQEEMLEYCQSNGIQLVAYSPLGRRRVFEVDLLAELASTYDTSVAQVTLAWLLNKDNVVPIPKASSRTHLEANFAAQDLELDDADVARIDGIDETVKVIDPFEPDNPS